MSGERGKLLSSLFCILSAHVFDTSGYEKKNGGWAE